MRVVCYCEEEEEEEPGGRRSRCCGGIGQCLAQGSQGSLYCFCHPKRQGCGQHWGSLSQKIHLPLEYSLATVANFLN